jgi:hypothetical protein
MVTPVQFNHGDAPKPILVDGLINIRAALRITVPADTAQSYNTKVKANLPLINVTTGVITPANQEVHVIITSTKENPAFIEIGESVGKFVVLANPTDLVIL